MCRIFQCVFSISLYIDYIDGTRSSFLQKTLFYGFVGINFKYDKSQKIEKGNRIQLKLIREHLVISSVMLDEEH